MHDSSGKKIKLLVGSKSGSSALKRQALIDIRGLAVPADIRNEWKVVGVGDNNDSSDEDNDFMTPLEFFAKRKKKGEQ